MTEQICFATLQFDEPWTLESYRKVGGYEAWEKVLREKISQEDIIEELVGEIHDESDIGSEDVIRRTEEYVVVSGRARIDQVPELSGIDMSERGAGSVGASGSAGARSTSQRTLTVIVKFDEEKKVRDVAYHTSRF